MKTYHAHFQFLVLCPCLLAACQPLYGGDFWQTVDDQPLIASIATQHSEALQLNDTAEPVVRNPVVLVHGMAGFRPITSILDYFYRVRRTMTARGHQVFAAQTDPFQSVSYRGRQLAVQVDEVLRITGAPQVHLVAHSQGGLDARYMISTLGYGDRVATLTSIATPHHGVGLIDMALETGPTIVGHVAKIVNALSDALLGGKADFMGQLHDMTRQYIETTFNVENLDDPRVEYFSYAGSTQDNALVDTHQVDLVNGFLMPTYRYIKLTEGDNDGLVAVKSAQWGSFMGTFAADHWDEIGQPMKSFYLPFDHLTFYCKLAGFLDKGGTPPQY
jgi:triacylglycerol lipase